jgi:histidine phosphotransferase ChpT
MMASDFEWLRLAELCTARLCHDFSGLVGTVSGGIELASEQRPHTEELGLAGEAARELTGRLRLYRAAWANQATETTVAALRELTRHLPRIGANTVVTDGIPDDTILPRPLAVVGLNLVMLAAQCLPKGGQVIMSGTAESLVVRLVGESAAWPEGFAACIATPDRAVSAALAPRALQMPLTVLIAAGSGVALSVPFGVIPPEVTASYPASGTLPRDPAR